MNQNLRANKILRLRVCPRKGDGPEPAGAWRGAGAADTLRPADSRRPPDSAPLVLSHWGHAGLLAVLLEPGPLIGRTTGQGPCSQTALRWEPGCLPALQCPSSNSAQQRGSSHRAPHAPNDLRSPLHFQLLPGHVRLSVQTRLTSTLIQNGLPVPPTDQTSGSQGVFQTGSIIIESSLEMQIQGAGEGGANGERCPEIYTTMCTRDK